MAKYGSININSLIPVNNKGDYKITNLENSMLNFWDVENVQTVDFDTLEGNVFVIGNLELINSNVFKQILLNQNAKITFYLIDTKHCDKNYSDIQIAMLLGRLLENVDRIKGVNFISNDRGFESLKFALNSYGIENVNYIHYNHNDEEEETVEEETENEYYDIEDKEVVLSVRNQRRKQETINRFYNEIDRRFAIQSNKSVNTKSVRNVAAMYGFDYVEMIDLLRKQYIVKFSKNNEKIRIRRK